MAGPMKRRSFLELFGGGLGSMLLFPPDYRRPRLTPRASLDIYGGIVARPSPNGGTGFFKVEKDSTGRWAFYTPLGNMFYLLASYTTTNVWYLTPTSHPPIPSGTTSVMQRKYNNSNSTWAKNANTRLLSWGFNAIGDYSLNYTYPVNTNGVSIACPVKLPFIQIVNALVTMFDSPTGAAANIPEPPKNIIDGIPAAISIYRPGHTADVFSPNFVTGYANVVHQQDTVLFHAPGVTGFQSIPWLIGITPDDPDYLLGLKNRGDNPVSPHPHIGYMIAVAAPDYNVASILNTVPGKVGVPWIDPVLYSKNNPLANPNGPLPWIQYLTNKYVTIGALNTAWNTSNFYTSFGSAGGYGVGTGVLDEDGRHTSWMGNRDPNLLSGANPNFAADCDQMLYNYAFQYASTAYNAIRAVDTKHLIFGPPSFGASGYQARPQVLQAMKDAGVGVFVFTGSFGGSGPNLVGAIDGYDRTGIPSFLWYAVSSNMDSPMAPTPSPAGGVADMPTQVYRATRYNSDIATFLNATGTNGDHFLLGINWWEWSDGNTFKEPTNYGLVTRLDNAYNGVEATTTSVVDSGGFTTIPEANNYGDFLTNVTATNQSIINQLAAGNVLPIPLGPAGLRVGGIGPGT